MPCWLLKAEPETRIEKGKDVKFSVDDFKACKVTQWEGVRNHEAKNMMKDKMKVGDKALFYASNCKVPGVTALAKVAKEGYPDWSAWDSSHPYYDPKTDKNNPTWYMVDLEFVSELPHLVPLKLLQHLATLPTPPACTPYITPSDLAAIKAMFLLNRGRLSVQPVEEDAYEAVRKLGEEGGWDGLLPAGGAGKAKAKAAPKGKGKGKAKVEAEEKEEAAGEKAGEEMKPVKVATGKAAAKADEGEGDQGRVASKRQPGARGEEAAAAVGERRSKRNKA